MQCQVPDCKQPTDQHNIWKCNGRCQRYFHAACIGVKREWEEMLCEYAVILCHQCRPEFVDIQRLFHGIHKQLELLNFIKNKMATIQTFEDALQDSQKSLDAILSQLDSNNKTSTKIKNLLAEMSQAPSSDVSMEQVKKTIEDTTTYQNQRLAESFGRIQEITSSHRDDIIKTITSAEKCPSDIILAVHDEVRSLISSIKTQKEDEVHEKTLAEELNEINALKSAEDGGWRFIGTKKVWKPDWSDFDARQRTRRKQEKEADKARRRQRKNRQKFQQQQQHYHQQHQQHEQQQRQQQQHHQQRQNPQQQSNCNSDVGRNIRLNTPHFELNNENSNINNNKNTATPPLHKFRSDKQLMDKAMVEFAGRPHPPAVSNSNFINFEKGETINPYQKEKTSIIPPLNVTTPQPATTTPEVADSMFCLDPMKPPIVRLTEQSAVGDGRFLLARLRESKVYENIRLYLAYLNDQSTDTCIDGTTATSMKVFLASEGLPYDPGHLMDILKEFNSSIGISTKDTIDDLEAYRKHVTNKRLHHLQQARESAHKFYRPSNFTK